MPLANGTLVAGYQIDHRIGRGGMGEVYLARHVVLGRLVALKVLTDDLAADEGFRSRFLSESRSAAALDHPNVVTVYEAGEFDGRLYLAMRYVDGEDLERLLAREGPLGPDRAIGLLTGIANALDAAHGLGLVHRDVKPSNILVAGSPGRDERAYLADFGLVKETGVQANRTATGQFLGSASYIAPEQIEGGAVDGRADVYSLAAVTFHALAGRPPFERVTEVATMWAHVHAPPPALSEVRPELASLDAVLQRGMAKEPADRPRTAGALLAQVAAAFHDGQEAPASARDRLGARPAVRAGAVSRRLSIGGISVALLVAALIGAVALSGRGPFGAPGPSASAPLTAERTDPPTQAVPSLAPTEAPPTVPATYDPSASAPTRGLPIGLALPPGRYETTNFQPQLTFTVDAGWTTIGTQFGDAEAGFDLVRQGRPSDRITILFSNTVSPTGCIEGSARLQTGGHDTVGPGETHLTVPGSLPFLDALKRAGVLAGGPWLDRSNGEDRFTTKILSRAAVQADFNVVRMPDCSGDQGGVAILRRIETAAGRPELDEWVVLPEGSWARVLPAIFGFVYEDIPGEIVIVVQSANRADFDAFLPIATAFLEGMLVAPPL